MPRNLQILILTITCIVGMEGVPFQHSDIQAQSPPPAATVQWRRTVNGWERADLWKVGNLSPDVASSNQPSTGHFAPDESGTSEFCATAPLPPPSIHPIAVAFFLVFTAAIMAMAAEIGSPKNASIQS